MIWFVIALIVAVVVFIKSYAWDTFWNSIGWSLVGLVVGCLFALLISIVTSCIPEHEDKVYNITESNSIVALSDSVGANGSFGFLGTGHIKDDLYYYYMVKNDTGYKAEKIPASDTIIRYTSSDFKIEKYEASGFKNKSKYIYAVPVGQYYVVYIPEGSIIENYRVDLE